MEFTKVVKEIKLMVQNKGVRIHQYLDDWFVRATSHQTCLHHTQTLVGMCQELVDSKHGEVRTGIQADLLLPRLPVCPLRAKSVPSWKGGRP